MAKKNKKNKQNNYAPTKDANGKKLSRKERKAQRKALLKSQKELEAQLVADGKIPRRNKYRSKNFFGRMLALVLMFFFGIFATVGAFFGFGAFAPMKDVFWLVGLDSTKFLTDEYSAKGILDLVGGILTDIQDHNIDSLGAISKYTPILDTYVDDIVESLSTLGVRVDKDTLKATPLSELGAYFQDEVMGSIVLGETLGVKPGGDAMLIGLCYGEEGIDYTVENDEFVQVTGGRAPTTLGDLMDSPTDIISQMRLGTLMGLNKNVTESALKDNAMMYALCYGKRGEDENADPSNYNYYVKDGNIVVLTNNAGGAATLAETDPNDYVHTFPTTLDGLMNHSNAVIESLELGDMLGLDGSDADTNGVMYSLAYGSRGTDWKYENGEIVMLEGHDPKYPTKMGDFISNSNSLIDGMEVATLMNIDHTSNRMMISLAYGTEMAKGEAFEAPADPWEERGGKYYDKNGQRVDEHGYLLDAEGGYLTEEVNETAGTGGSAQTTTRKQYKDDARFIYVYDASGEVTGIQMLPNPNDPQGKPYEKKKISDLTDGDADLVEGMKIGDTMEIDSSSSALMQAMKDWTIGDLKDQNKIEKLTIGEVLGEEGMTSNIMQALKDKTLEEMKDQNTIDALKLSDVLDIHEEDAPDGSYTKSSGIMRAMQDWHLDDLNSQYRIDRLKISNVIGIDENSSSLMQAMKDWRISDLNKQEKIDALKLGAIITIDKNSPPILKALENTQIGELSSDVDGLRLMDILEEEDIKDNKFLKSLKLSPLTSLGDDLKKLSAREVFGADMYSYLDPNKPYGDTAQGAQDDVGKSYYELYKAYETNKKDSETLSGTKPIAREIAEGEEVRSYFVHGSDSTHLVRGFYTNENGIKTAVPESDVHTRVEAATKKYYTVGEQKLTATYAWRVVNYDESKLDELPAGDEVIDSEGTFYYKTGGTQYEIKEDGYSLYYLAAVEGEDATRVDLEREIVSYIYNAGAGDITITKNTAGKWSYTPKDPGTETEVNVYTHDEEGNTYDYIKTEIEVLEGYYQAPAEGTTTITGDVYGENDVEEKFEIAKTDGTGKPVPVERYLSGVWYFLFGGEGDNCFTDASDAPVLDLTGTMSGMSGKLSDTELWKLYFHDVLKTNPFVDIDAKFEGGLNVGGQGEKKKVKNLNECTLNESVELVKQLVNGIPQQ